MSGKFNAISLANSVEEVVNAINKAHNGESTQYFGGWDTRSAEEMAGEYAWNAADENDHIDDDSLEGQLEFIQDAGAIFDYPRALEWAIVYRNASAN